MMAPLQAPLPYREAQQRWRMVALRRASFTGELRERSVGRPVGFLFAQWHCQWPRPQVLQLMLLRSRLLRRE